MTDIVPIRTLADDRKLHSHIPELDGLRAVAVLAVMLFHKGTIGFDLGWVGVNLFFVLSGFLITGILLDAKGSPNYFRNFYIRRILRIFPIYYLTLMIMYQPLFANQRGTDDGIFYLFYLQNYIQGIKNWQVDFCYCYNHTWSLAVEEQFYIVWPFIVYKLSKKTWAF